MIMETAGMEILSNLLKKIKLWVNSARISKVDTRRVQYILLSPPLNKLKLCLCILDPTDMNVNLKYTMKAG